MFPYLGNDSCFVHRNLSRHTHTKGTLLSKPSLTFNFMFQSSINEKKKDFSEVPDQIKWLLTDWTVCCVASWRCLPETNVIDIFEEHWENLTLITRLTASCKVIFNVARSKVGHISILQVSFVHHSRSNQQIFIK